jgi:hypothetical protein
MKKIIVIILFSIDLFAQSKKDPRGYQIILSQLNKAESQFMVYEPNYVAKGICKGISEAKNQNPEQVFEALLSETSFEWTKHNSIGGEIKARKDEYYTKMKTMDKTKNYYALRCKWLFEIGGRQYALIKFDFVNQDRQKATGCYTLVQKNNRWYKHETAYTTNINLLFIAFKDDKLKALFEAKPNSNLLHNALLKQTAGKEGLDLDKLFKQYDNWQKGKDDEKINYFLDLASWINQKY